MWAWTLNWGEMRRDLVVGSCPMATADIDRIRESTRATALLSLQHGDCWAHFGIDYPRHREHGQRLGLAMVHVPMRDFDFLDQRHGLARAARVLHELVFTGHKVYVHCTAGINRAPLVVLGYLTFIEGLAPDAALALIQRARPQAAPDGAAYEACRRDLVESRQEEIRLRAYLLHRDDPRPCMSSNWIRAENEALRGAVLHARGELVTGSP